MNLGPLEWIGLIASLITITLFIKLIFDKDRLNNFVNSIQRFLESQTKKSYSRANWIQPSVWISRKTEVAQLRKKLRNHRVVILEGPRGVGKTSVVMSGVDELAYSSKKRFRRPDVRWVKLEFGDYEEFEIFDAIAHALDFDSVAAAQPIQKAILLQRLLQSRHILMVIDNFESISPENVAVRDFLGGLPNSVRCIVVSSRKVMDIRGAAVVEVKGFSLEETALLIQQKFENGNLDQLPSDEQISELHTLTGGTALAIDWVVGRVRTGMSFREVFSTLRTGRGNIFSTLFDAFWKDLNTQERKNLAIAAMLPQPAPINLLSASSENWTGNILKILNMNLALVARPDDGIDSPMLQLHPLTQAYASIKLARTPKRLKASYTAKAAEYFTDLLSRVAENGSEPNPNIVNRQIHNSVEISRQCLKWSLDIEFINLVMAIRGSVLTSGLISERAELCQAGAEITENDAGMITNHLKLATCAGAALGLLGKHTDSQTMLSKAADLAEKQGYFGQAAHTRRALAASYYRSGDTEKAIAILEPTRQWSLDASDLRVAVDIDYLLANIAYVIGELDEATRLCERMISESEPANYERALAYAHEQFALVCLEQGKRKDAKRHAKIALEVAKEHLDERQCARAELALAKIYIAGGRPFAARELVKHATQVFAEVGLRNEEQEAHAVVSYCSNLKNILLIVLRQGSKTSSFLKLPIGGD